MAVILLDVLADSLCIAMMLRVMGRQIRAMRVLAAAVIGAFSAQSIRLLGFSGGWLALCWLPIAYVMAFAADERVSLRAALVLLGCQGLLGGTVYALCGALGSLGGAWYVGAAFALILSANLVRARRVAQDVHTVRIRISHGEYAAEMEALVDSGNCLRDYLTGRPVIVLPEAARARLGLEAAPLRPIFADTAGGRQMMACFTPQAVTVIKDGQAMEVSACAAFSPGLSGETPALLPLSLLTERTNRDKSRLDREGNAYGKAEG